MSIECKPKSWLDLLVACEFVTGKVLKLGVKFPWHDDDIKLFFINEEAPHRYLFRCTIGQIQWNMFFKVMVCNQFVICFVNHTCQISVCIEIIDHPV